MMGLCKIEIITGMEKFNKLKKVLSDAGVGGMTISQVLGCGREKGSREYEIDERCEMELLPKQMVSVVVDDKQLDQILEDIKKALYTGHIGDGKIFVYHIDNVIRVRTGDDGVDAL